MYTTRARDYDYDEDATTRHNSVGWEDKTDERGVRCVSVPDEDAHQIITCRYVVGNKTCATRLQIDDAYVTIKTAFLAAYVDTLNIKTQSRMPCATHAAYQMIKYIMINI